MATNIKANMMNIVRKYLAKRFRLKLLDHCTNISVSDKNYLQSIVRSGSSVIGYVPFVKNHTNYILYNFFSTNYGVRSNTAFIVAIFDSDGNIQSARKRVLFHRSIEWHSSEIVDADNIPEEGSLVILSINKSFPVDHGFHQGQLRFWGLYDNSSMVHSMPITHTIRKRLVFAERMFHSQHSAKSVICRFNSKFIYLLPKGDVSDSVKVPGMAYNLLIRDDGNITSVHHSAPFNRETRLINRPIDELANPEFHSLIGIPPVNDLDVQIFFREGFAPGAKIKIILERLGVNNKIVIIDHVELKVPVCGSIRLSEFFKTLDSTMGVWARIEPMEGRFDRFYANVTYINKKTSYALDTVHSHNLATTSPRRSLKFAPIIHDHNISTNSLVYSSYLAIWGDASEDFPVKARLRIFSAADPSFESVQNIVVTNKAVTYINSEVLTREFYKRISDSKGSTIALPEVAEKFVVQLESEDRNLNSNAYIFSHTSNGALYGMACDHLTGG